MQVFRCMICGESYLGTQKPSHCPFCGAHLQYLVLAEEWKDTNDVELSEVSRKNLEASLELEVGNAEFYLCVAKTSKNEVIRGMFKALSKVEKEHAETICKILKKEMPAIELKKDMCSENDMESVQESLQREERATQRYSEFLGQTKEERVKELFRALIEIESDHIELDKQKLAELSG